MNVKIKLILILLFFPFIGMGQGFSIPSELYPGKVPDSYNRKTNFYQSEKTSLSDSVKTDTSRTKSDVLYRMAIILHETGEQNLMICIDMLDLAIAQEPTNANFHAVRGIIKYNWGAWSYDYDIGEGCLDIRKAISLGLSITITNSETITGILDHPSCN